MAVEGGDHGFRSPETLLHVLSDHLLRQSRQLGQGIFLRSFPEDKEIRLLRQIYSELYMNLHLYMLASKAAQWSQREFPSDQAVLRGR